MTTTDRKGLRKYIRGQVGTKTFKYKNTISERQIEFKIECKPAYTDQT